MPAGVTSIIMEGRGAGGGGMFGSVASQGDIVRAQLTVTPGEVLDVYSAPGAGPTDALTQTSYVRLATDPAAQFVRIQGGGPRGYVPNPSAVFAPAIALQITPGDTNGGPAGVAGSGGAAGAAGQAGYITLYLGN